MSAEVINLNSDLKRLQDEGYEIEVRDAYAIVSDVPYLDSSRTVQRGILISPLAMSGNYVRYDGVHTIYFQGSTPYRNNGERLDAIIHSQQNCSLAGIHVDMMFSNKPANGYADYYEKFTRYIDILSAEAKAVDPTVTAATFKKIVSSDNSVFHYADTNASRGAIADITDKLKGYKVGIIGLGGTGSYLLDQLAKLPLAEIHLYDGDIFCQHNAFRAPGAPAVGVFQEQPYKVDYYQAIYSNMHRHIMAHPYNLDEDNISELSALDFVFIAMDSGPSKKDIVEFLRGNAVGFIDTGIDINRVGTSLIGMARSTMASCDDWTAAERHISYDVADKDLYQSNVQTSDLNALCALMAVIQWKQSLGFYADNNHHKNCVYTTNDGEFKWD